MGVTNAHHIFVGIVCRCRAVLYYGRKTRKLENQKHNGAICEQSKETKTRSRGTSTVIKMTIRTITCRPPYNFHTKDFCFVFFFFWTWFGKKNDRRLNAFRLFDDFLESYGTIICTQIVDVTSPLRLSHGKDRIVTLQISIWHEIDEL